MGGIGTGRGPNRQRKAPYAPPGDRDPWDKWPGESQKSYSRFCLYLDIPTEERTIKAAALKFGRDPRKIRSLAAAWFWVDRADEYDHHRLIAAREARHKAEVEAIQEMQKRHIRLATTLVATAEKELGKLHKVCENALTRKLRPNQILNFLDLGVKLERLSRGEPGEITEHQAQAKGLSERAAREIKKALGIVTDD